MDDARAEYLRAIEQRFVALRGRGFMLSPRDLDIVERWRGAGVPVRIVLRALEDGVKAFVDRNTPGMPLPSSLAYFENQVDKVAILWRERTMSWGVSTKPGAPGGSSPARSLLLEAAMEAVTDAGQESDDAAIKVVLRDTWRSLRQSADRGDEEPWALIAALDAAMVEAVEATLEISTLDVLRAEALDSAPRRGGARMSPEARGARQRATLTRLLRTRYGLPDLVEVLNDVRV
jgi:hypothetical protein